MDYLEIVLRGYFDDNNRGYLENYFYREFKKAEKQFFLPDAFFGGCRKIIEQLEQHIRFKLLNRKGDSSINENDFTTHLENVPGGWGTYDIHKIELSIIKEAINKAFHKATNSNTKSSLVFFNKVLDGEIIGQLDILNTVDEMTGFDIVKLKALQRDLEIYLEMDYWETRDAISQVEIKIEMSRLEKNKLLEFVVEDGKKIPKRKIFKKENGKIISSTKTIDIEDMFFPDKSIFIRRVINFLKEKIKLAENPNSGKDQTQPPKNKINDFNKSETHLSVPDWTIIFYYIDASKEKQKGTKTKRFENFIKDNRISTTQGNFKKEYYKICNRINLNENSRRKKLPPLPPERIEKILSYIKNNKKATERAKNDIGYLTNEVSNYKEKAY